MPEALEKARQCAGLDCARYGIVLLEEFDRELSVPAALNEVTAKK